MNPEPSWFVSRQVKLHANHSQNYLVQAPSAEAALDVVAKQEGGAQFGTFRVFPASTGVQFSVQDKVTHKRYVARTNEISL